MFKDTIKIYNHNRNTISGYKDGWEGEGAGGRKGEGGGGEKHIISSLLFSPTPPNPYFRIF